ncbi:hypothetical protein DI09_6p520 [Mitosporidium daphniae]|uniref:aspartate--tRNA ligase n=1 Tax=Mitosporidium daphniae TaxID=1485682 RepID=A0A098VN48_9MICR|nr:uncharacterized protein DI09_6p520 [Mitosporidium daphniae]KGG50468.1 hypothetical protein DI09_6p520 [Mitosporidium daphniae]|eukprot:XP_013236895.1 uncharacterized protein DI09_6p520 [Mitosporidium daphniae]
METAKRVAAEQTSVPVIFAIFILGRIIIKALYGRRLVRSHNWKNILILGKQAFVVLRESPYVNIQLIVYADNVSISKAMLKFCGSLSKETIVDIVGKVVKASTPILSCSVFSHEIHVEELWVVSPSATLPINLEDASRPDFSSSPEEEALPRVNLDTRLDNRVIDLRTPANDAIFQMLSEIEWHFERFFHLNDFRKIHSPKMISAASEGGANVFKVKYFNGDAFLAQSPQLYKQMAICAHFNRVYEIGPVFRAENSFTHRHLTEFTGVDLEMTFTSHYHEVMDMIASMFVFVFDALKDPKYSKYFEAIHKQHPFEELQYLEKTLVLQYSEGVAMLRAVGIEMAADEDLRHVIFHLCPSTTNEKLLGKLKLANAYDFFIRGEEILSGAQRINDYNLLVQKATEHGIDLSTINSYLEAFRYGAPPHAGGGIGLERVVMLYFGLGNIRKTSLFPRDPKRLTP